MIMSAPVAQFTFECHSWHAQSFIAESEFALTQLDEMHEFRNGIQSKQRQKPLIEFPTGVAIITTGEIEELHRFRPAVR